MAPLCPAYRLQQVNEKLLQSLPASLDLRIGHTQT